MGFCFTFAPPQGTGTKKKTCCIFKDLFIYVHKNILPTGRRPALWSQEIWQWPGKPMTIPRSIEDYLQAIHMYVYTGTVHECQVLYIYSLMRTGHSQMQSEYLYKDVKSWEGSFFFHCINSPHQTYISFLSTCIHVHVQYAFLWFYTVLVRIFTVRVLSPHLSHQATC